MTKAVLATALVVLLVGRTASAETLTLDQTIAKAVARAPAIEASRATVDAAGSEVDLANAGYLPRVDAAIVGTAGFGGSTTSAMGVRGIMGSPFAQHFAAGVEGSWTIFDFGRTGARVDAAQARVRSARAGSALARRSAALEAIDAFAQAALSREEVGATSAVIALRERGAKAATSLADAGLRPRIDALLATARADEAKATLAVAQAKLAAANARLAAILGSRFDRSLTLDVRGPDAAVVADTLAHLPQRLRDPLHDLAAAERERAAALERAATAEHLPKLVVAGSAGYARRTGDPGYWAAGAAVVVPLLDFVGPEAEADRASAEARAAGARARQADMELAAEVGSDVAILRSAGRAQAARDASLAASRSALQAAEARYAAGELTFQDVDATRDGFVRAGSARRTLGIVTAIALARIRAWVGAGVARP